MAEFGNNQIEGGIRASTPLVAPVENKSGEILARGVTDFFGSIKSGFDAQQKANAEAQSSALLTDYQQRILDIASFVESGDLSPQAARTKLRALNSQFIADNPGLQDDINKIHKDSLSSVGLGAIIKTGNEQQEALMKGKQAALQNGWGPDLDTAWHNQQAYETSVKQTNILIQDVKLKEAEFGASTVDNRIRATQALHQLSYNADPWFKGRLAQASQEIAGGRNKDEVFAEVEAEFNEKFAEVNNLKAIAGGDFNVDYLIEPMKRRFDLFKRQESGEISAEVAQKEIKRIDAQLGLMLRQQSPDLARTVVFSEMLGVVDPNVARELHQGALEMLNKNSTIQQQTEQIVGGEPVTGVKPADVVEQGPEVNDYLNIVEKGMQGERSEGLSQELDTNVNNIVKGTHKFAESSEGPKDFKALIDFYSKPSTSQYIKSSEGISAEDKRLAVDAVQRFYGDELLPLVRERWEGIDVTGLQGEAQTTGFGMMGGAPRQDTEVKPIDRVIETSFDGVGVVFKPRQGFENDPKVRGIVRSLNSGSSSIGVPLNKYLRALSTLSGRDAKDIWENDLAPRIFDVQPNQNAPEGQEFTSGTTTPEGAETAAETPSEVQEEGVAPTVEALSFADPELSLQDFNSDPEVAESQALNVINDTFVSDPNGAIKAKSRIEIAKSFTGFKESNREENKAISSFIKKHTGTDIDPAKTAWCAAVLNAIIEANGGEGTGKLNARSFLDWGKNVDKPSQGDIVVLWRESPDSWKGHVGIYMGKDENGDIKVFGGNQSNAMKESTYPAERVLGYRRG